MNLRCRRLLSYCFLAVCLISVRLHAQAFDSAYKAAVGELLPRLEKVAAWCHSKGLHADRDDLYALILDYQPDHRRARAILRYKKSRKKGWVQSARYTKPVNKKSAARYLDELMALRETELGPFRDTMLPLIKEGGDDLSLKAREKLLKGIVTLHPFHKEAHRMLGEEYELGKWWLAETVSARKRRPMLKSLAQACLSEIKEAEVVPLTDAVKALGVNWVGGIRSTRVRIFSTVSKDEMVRVFRLVEAAWPFLEKSLGARPYWVRDFRILTLKNKDEAAKVFANHPKATGDQRALVRRVGGMWIDNKHMVEYRENADRRIEGVLRQALGMSYAAHYRICSDQAWAWEGLGLHVTWLLRGTRNTSFGKVRKYADSGNDWERLEKPNADWLHEARRLLESSRKPNLHTVLNLKVNDLGVRELLYGYALVVYLFESRPKDLVSILTGMGDEQKLKPEDAIAKVLGWDLDTLERRLLRWLREMER